MNVSRISKKHWSKKDTKKIEKAVKWYAKELDLETDCLNIYLEGPLEENGEEYWAYATPLMQVFLSPCSGEDPLEYLAHELVHIKQFQSGKLSYYNKFTIWKARINYETDYRKQPWEKEAWAKQTKLRRKLRKKTGI